MVARNLQSYAIGKVVIRGAIPDYENAKEFLKSVEEQFKGSSKANASTLILKMLTTNYDGLSGVCKHIMMMNDMDSKLNAMDIAISEGFLVHFIMTSLPAQFDPFKINYNTQKEIWKMSELIAMCVQRRKGLKLKSQILLTLLPPKAKKRNFLKETLNEKKEILTRQVQVMAKNQALNVDYVRILAISKRSAQTFENGGLINNTYNHLILNIYETYVYVKRLNIRMLNGKYVTTHSRKEAEAS
ncbi:hypothetical protein Tco_0565641 [Tanacetum coccineum]